jgi:hypothetical protein
VVRVDGILRAPETLTDFAGREITVRLERPGGVKPGDKQVFFSNGWLYGASLAVQEVGHLAPWSDDVAALRAAIDRAAAQQSERALAARLDDSTMVVSGRVLAVRPAPADPQRRPSEHDPQWQLADVEVSSMEKGNAPLRQVTFCFPGSTDELWSESPKFRPGQTGVWLLREADRAKGRPLPPGLNLGVWDPRDYHAPERLEAIRAQIRAPRAPKPQ